MNFPLAPKSFGLTAKCPGHSDVHPSAVVGGVTGIEEVAMHGGKFRLARDVRNTYEVGANSSLSNRLRKSAETRPRL